MAYTDEELRKAGKDIVEAFNTVGRRLDSLETKDTRAKAQNDWESGREFARSRGFHDDALQELESEMEETATMSHQVAIAAGLGRPSSRLFGGPSAARPDEWQLLLSGDEEGHERLVRQRLRRGE